MSRYKGSVSLDFLFTLIPILLMLQYTLSYTHMYIEKSTENLQRQIEFDRLVSVSDLVVKNLAAKKEEGLLFTEKKIYPNLIDSSQLAKINRKQLAESAGMERLSIGFGPSEYGTCIYRLVVHENQIKKLYFCGG